MFRKIAAIILITLLGLTVSVGIVYAAELIANGDFSLLTGSLPTHWTPWAGDTIVADSSGACGSGVATVQGVSIATAQQCIHITNPGTSWTFALDMAIYNSSYSAAVADFFTSVDCSGTRVHREQSAITNSSTMQRYSSTFTYDTAANGVNSVLIAIETARFSMVNAIGCFDNVSLNASGATAVKLHQLSAIPAMNNSRQIALEGIAGSIVLAVSMIIFRQRKR